MAKVPGQEVVDAAVREALASASGATHQFDCLSGRTGAKCNCHVGLAVAALALACPHQKTPKPQSRPQRWADACSRAVAALDDLIELQGEYSEWKDGLPDNLSSGSLAEKLDAVVDLDLEGAKSTVEEAEGIDLPRGFGRD